MKIRTLAFLSLLLPASPQAQALNEVVQATTEADPQGNLWLKFPTVPGKTYVVEGSNSVDANTYHPIHGGVFYGDGTVKSFFIRPAPPPGSSTPTPYNDKPINASDWLITLAPSDQPGDNLSMLVTRIKQAPETSWTILTTQPIMRPFDLLNANPSATTIDQETSDFRWQLNLNFAVSQTPLDLSGIPGPESLSGTDAEEWNLLDANKMNAMGFLQIPTGDAVPEPRPEGSAIFFRARIIEGDINGNGLPDFWELLYNFNPYDSTLDTEEEDSDNDGLTNLEEYNLNTNPLLADTDGDGFSDGEEISNDSNPLNPASRPLLMRYMVRYAASTYQHNPATATTPAYTFQNAHFNLRGAEYSTFHTVASSYSASALDTAWSPEETFPETPGDSSSYRLFPKDFDGQLPTSTYSEEEYFLGGGFTHSINQEEGNQKEATTRQFRIWLDRGETVPTDEPITRTFLKIRHRAIGSWPRSVLPEDELEDATVVTLTIPVGQRYSEPYDLAPTDGTEEEGYEKIEDLLRPIEIVDKDKKHATNLRIAKMTESGVLSSATADGIETAYLNIKKDSDHFYIRLKGGKKEGPVTVKVATINNQDPFYNNNPTELDLHVDGDDLISPALLLVSDDDDDKFSVEGYNHDNIKMDLSPEDDSHNDRTYKIQLGGSLVVTEINYINSLGIKPINDVAASVKVVKTADVKVVVPKFQIGSDSNSPYLSALGPNFNEEVATTENIKKLFKIVNERYAQVGIKVNYQLVHATIPWSDNFDLTDGLDIISTQGKYQPEFSNFINFLHDHDADGNLRNENLLFEPVFSPSDWKNTIKICYAGRVFDKNNQPIGGATLTHSSGGWFQNSIFLSNPANELPIPTYTIGLKWAGFALSHEIGHALSDSDHQNQSGVAYPNNHLMMEGSLVSNGGNPILFSKRINMDLESKLLKSNLIK